ncbi:MAG: class I SAM-dependent methyltransferase [Clostridiales bacterium]|nr:class I SAM-dependent methyltransferase [Clostridiales bacterium]
MHCNQARQIYDQNIQAYLKSPVGGKNNIQSKALSRFLRFLKPGARVLDLGCGPGMNAELVMNSYPHIRVTGLDLSRVMIRHARKRAPKGDFHCLDIRTASYPENAFDAIIVASVAYHLKPAELAELIRNAAAALKPDGLLFLNFWSGGYSGFKQLDFANRPMMVYYHEDTFLSQLIRLHAFGSLSVKKHPRQLDTASGQESITDVYYVGQALKTYSAADLLIYDSMYSVAHRVFEKGVRKKSL